MSSVLNDAVNKRDPKIAGLIRSALLFIGGFLVSRGILSLGAMESLVDLGFQLWEVGEVLFGIIMAIWATWLSRTAPEKNPVIKE